ncbi:hypothetical protein Glove_285g3 [Diversispora epigaea]|uniref:Nudix hydrolase domain-containing protein n=1 Tax=Diversispora epigaea TaxID=1348612 RepID=A0A397I289_9GLOM|nr:hypothetical protein Glove_285g3 [Diversispora epigaea]
MSTLNKIKIIEYTTTVLYDKKTKKIWVSKRTNPDKEFYEHWQSPGGHVEESDISAKWAARREVFEETGIYLKLEELNYWKTQHYYKENQWRIVVTRENYHGQNILKHMTIILINPVF